jgi:hypothetical protein
MPGPERRYTISELLRIAENRTLIAGKLKQTGVCGAANCFYEWSNVVCALRFLKNHGLPQSGNEVEIERELPVFSDMS